MTKARYCSIPRARVYIRPQENAHGPYLPLAVSALATERIQLGTAVAMAFPRSPTITAHQAWDLHRASGGRFYLGLGSQVKAHNERRYGIAWHPPAPRMRDYIGAVRAVWRAWEKEEPLDYRSREGGVSQGTVAAHGVIPRH